MSQQSTSVNPSEMGCELPEYLRQYYLEAMDIVCWQEQDGFSPTQIDDTDVTDIPHAKRLSKTQAKTHSQQVPDTAIDSGQWLELERIVENCSRCESLCHSRTQTVFGVGNRQADVLVIGEAPGADEDRQGEPFVGRSGQLLTAMLNAIKLQRQEVFIVNTIKCRPPDDRDPSKREVENCGVYLRQQIALVQPKVILAVGRIAAQNLLATDTAIGKLREQEHSFDGLPVIVTYHPAYLLRKPSEKRKAWQDLLRLQELMASWQ